MQILNATFCGVRQGEVRQIVQSWNVFVGRWAAHPDPTGWGDFWKERATLLFDAARCAVTEPDVGVLFLDRRATHTATRLMAAVDALDGLDTGVDGQAVKEAREALQGELGAVMVAASFDILGLAPPAML